MPIIQYETYKDSGIQWLGKIPDHWKIKRVKDISSTQSGTTPTSNSRYYYENGKYGWVRTTDLNNSELYNSEYKVTDLAIKECRLAFLPIDSVLVAMYGGFGTIGKNAILKKELTINQSVCAILPNRKQFDSHYLQRFLQFFRRDWRLFADGTRKDPNINQDAVKNLFIVYPPLEEQTTIAQYLDQKTAAIDKKVALLEQKITTYQNLRKSLINETVCRGLDKSVTFKDSGIDWIGQIPAHWEVKRGKSVFFEVKDRSESGEGDLLSVSEYYGVAKKSDTLDDEDIHLSRAESLVDYKLCKKGDLVINIMLAWKGALGITSLDGLVSPSYAIYRPYSKNQDAYYHYLLRTDIYKAEFKRNSTGVIDSRLRLYSDSFFNIAIICPPKEEQTAIASYLDEKTQRIDAIVKKLNEQIGTLKEFRKTLINDVVTGKIRVATKEVTLSEIPSS